MEARFSRSFADVRVHADREAAESAAELGARAFASGNHISFGANQLAPHTRAGRGLIAHELAHVAQNRFGNGSAESVEPKSSRAEAEAHRAGSLAGIGLPVGSLTAHHAGVALTPTSDSVIPLASYSAGDWAVTADDERQILALLRADPDLSATIIEINAAHMLRELLERVDEPENRRDLLRLLGARLNPAARALVEPIIQDLDSNVAGVFGSQIQYNLGRRGVSGGAAPFNRSAYNDLIPSSATAPFGGSGATGVNSSERGYTDWAGAGRNAFDQHINAIPGDLAPYLNSLTPDQRRRQVELLVNQPISTNYASSYAGQLPSRLQVMRAAGAAHNIEGELVAAIILAEQRDQSRAEDARDFILGLARQNTSIGLGQVLPSTVRGNDLFADLLSNDRTTTFAATTARSNVSPEQTAWLLASDETNIFATARYIRILANAGAMETLAGLPNTRSSFPGLNPAAYANNSSTWPEDNVGALGMYYTSPAWTDDLGSVGWGDFVLEAYRDVKAAGLF
jgi:hypothetical protein